LAEVRHGVRRLKFLGKSPGVEPGHEASPAVISFALFTPAGYAECSFFDL